MSLELAYQLPAPECTCCGRPMRHLYDDCAKLTKQLTNVLQTNDVPKSEIFFGEVSGIDITDFIQTYYSWFQKHPDKNIKFTPSNIVARALLAFEPLCEKDLPFGTKREPDGQRSVFEPGLCCLRMLQCDPLTNLR